MLSAGHGDLTSSSRGGIYAWEGVPTTGEALALETSWSSVGDAGADIFVRDTRSPILIVCGCGAGGGS